MMVEKYTKSEIMRASEILVEMRMNCIKKESDKYDDPKRKEKYKALTIAINELCRSFWNDD